MTYSFPYLVSINSVLPAIIAGNAVLLKPSPQTPLTAERFALALTRAGVPEDVIQVVHMSPELTSHVIKNPLVDFVSFTGSVSGGRSVAKAATDGAGFTGVALEVMLGFACLLYYLMIRSSAAKIRLMLDLTLISTTQLLNSWTVRKFIRPFGAYSYPTGAFFNSGQSCCSIEVCSRYVHRVLQLTIHLVANLCARRCVRHIYFEVYRHGQGLKAPFEIVEDTNYYHPRAIS